jgi:hypothetical protein
MPVDVSFSYLHSAATASFDKKSSTGTAQAASRGTNNIKKKEQMSCN